MKINRYVIALSALLPGSYLMAAPLSGSDPAEGHGEVYRVIDGDTYIVNVLSDEVFARFKSEAEGNQRRERYLNDQHKSIRLRLANVDTPESVHANESMNTQEGKDISNLVKNAVEGEDAYFKCYDWGDYGRLICNMAIYQNDQWFDVGHWLIRDGYSDYIQRWGDNPFFHNEYLEATH